MASVQEVLTVAKQQAKALQLETQLRVFSGDFHNLQLSEKAFDVAILANITHGEAVIIDVFPGSVAGDFWIGSSDRARPDLFA